MEALKRYRILRQHLETDKLLGVAAVPRAVAAVPRAAAALHAPDDLASKRQALHQLDDQQVKGCTRCDLCQGRIQTVFGEGDPDAPVMFIGEGPGQNEDEQGRPFVGRAGEMLNKWIVAMGFERREVYIANVVKCRPPNNRTPTPLEVATCSAHLRRQIQIISPKVIVTLGAPAAKMVLETDEGIGQLRGRWFSYNHVEPTIPVMPTYHPAYLLRAYTKDNRAKVWSDLKAAGKRLGT